MTDLPRTPSLSLKGKTALVTGASRGIGKAIGVRAARDGARVVLFAKTTEPHPKLPGTLYTAAEEIREAGGEALREHGLAGPQRAVEGQHGPRPAGGTEPGTERPSRLCVCAPDPHPASPRSRSSIAEGISAAMSDARHPVRRRSASRSPARPCTHAPRVAAS